LANITERYDELRGSSPPLFRLSDGPMNSDLSGSSGLHCVWAFVMEWNKLSALLQSMNMTLQTFRCKLKTYLFQQ